MTCTPFFGSKNDALALKIKALKKSALEKIAPKKFKSVSSNKQVFIKGFLANNRTLSFVLLAFSTLFILGCDPDESSSLISTGQFIDSPVKGLTYKTPSRSGTTNAAGEFQYQAGENITFSVGSIELPEIQAMSVISPLDIFSTTSVTDIQVVNLSRLLQTLDINQNQTDGIDLDPVGLAATAGLSIDFSSLSFELDIQPIIDAMAGRTALVSSEEAVYHLRTALPYQASDFTGSWLFQTLQTPKFGALNPDSFELLFEQAAMTELGITSVFKVLSNPETLDTTFPYNLTLTLTGNDRGEISQSNDTFDFAYLSASKDVAIGIKEQDNTQSLTLAVKGLLNFSLDKLVGNWAYFSLQTPNNGNGDPTQYGYSYQSVTIDSSADVSASVISSHNITTKAVQTYPLALVQSSSRMTLVKGDEDFFATNSEFTVMVTPGANTSNNQFRFLLKQASSYSQSDLTGDWFGASISTPKHTENSSAYFSYEAIRLTLDENGKVYGKDILSNTLIDMHNLTVNLSSNGSFSFQPALSEQSYWAMDETKTMIAILTIEAVGSQTLTLLLKQGDEASTL